ncbi:ester cyclase [Sinosporangium siamense]|uniref:SnoaL-like domain-containing protein n=1 Tax=Sinosporangium siamense TaxID=1367973 RepID=A0A919RMW5_9ACTN|nr:ester cyclase [Sinosporangium siamense]GII96117.1 hypothetical protein Ssi02_63480 [Sinosporangium siamense]
MNHARQAMDRYISGFCAHDMDMVLSAFSPTAVGISPEGPAEGHEEFASHIALFWQSFPDAHMASWESVDAGDTTVDEVSITGTHTGDPWLVAGVDVPPTGRAVQLRGCYVCTAEYGYIVSLRLYYDQLELLAQLGRLSDTV